MKKQIILSSLVGFLLFGLVSSANANSIRLAGELSKENNLGPEANWTKLSSFQKFYKIDDDFTGATITNNLFSVDFKKVFSSAAQGNLSFDKIALHTFDLANLIASQIQNSEKNEEDHVIKDIIFIIRPLTNTSFKDMNAFPKFLARCEATKFPLTLQCLQKPKSEKILLKSKSNPPQIIDQFILENVNLKISFKEVNSKWMQVSSYSMNLNESEYNQLKEHYPDLAYADTKAFFNTYFEAFFEAWKNKDWAN